VSSCASGSAVLTLQRDRDDYESYHAALMAELVHDDPNLSLVGELRELVEEKREAIVDGGEDAARAARDGASWWWKFTVEILIALGLSVAGAAGAL
jgi:hypothetical protein